MDVQKIQTSDRGDDISNAAITLSDSNLTQHLDLVSSWDANVRRFYVYIHALTLAQLDMHEHFLYVHLMCTIILLM